MSAPPALLPSPSSTWRWLRVASLVVASTTVGKVLVARFDVVLLMTGVLYTTCVWLLPESRSQHPARARGLLVASVGLALACLWSSNNEAQLILLPLLPAAMLLEGLAWAGGIAAVTLAGTVTVDLLHHESWLVVVQDATPFAAGSLFMLVLATVMQRERAWHAAFQQTATLREELLATRERQRVTQAIHDGAGHFLTAALMHLEAARHAPPEQQAEMVTQVSSLLRDCMREIRRAVAALRDSSPGLVQALEELVEASRAAGVPTLLDASGSYGDLSAELQYALFASLQEALTNVRRHAQATQVKVTLQRSSGRVELLVVDNGRGAASLAMGMGLTGIQGRMHAWGGDARFSSGPDGGFSVLAWVPT